MKVYYIIITHISMLCMFCMFGLINIGTSAGLWLRSWSHLPLAYRPRLAFLPVPRSLFLATTSVFRVAASVFLITFLVLFSPLETAALGGGGGGGGGAALTGGLSSKECVSLLKRIPSLWPLQPHH